MSAIKDILDKIDKLSPADQERLKTILLSKTFTKSISIEEFVTKERFANGRVCPVCGATHVVRNGKRKDGTQKYICKDCGKSFVITTNSIVSGTRKDFNVWIKYVDCMLNGFSVRKAAEECGIHRNTAFAWRHKILDALQNMANDVILDGIELLFFFVDIDDIGVRFIFMPQHKVFQHITFPDATLSNQHDNTSFSQPTIDFFGVVIS